MSGIQQNVFPMTAEADAAAASWLAVEIRASVESHGSCVMAISGGRSPWPMFKTLAGLDDVPWDQISIFQVDERIAPAGDPDRNLTQITSNLLRIVPGLAARTHPMPVNDADLNDAAKAYAQTIESRCGRSPRFDIVHLGLGPDGHTASLVPGDGVLDVEDCDVALTTGMYQDRRRMTLTYPIINRSRRILWQVVGAGKRAALRKLLAGDVSIPAGRIARPQAVLFADEAAAGDALTPDDPAPAP